MANQWRRRLLSLSIISVSFIVGIAGGNLLRLQFQDKSQSPKIVPVADSTPKLLQPKISPSAIAETKLPYITIKAVGDTIPGSNFPDDKLRSDRNELFPESVRVKFQDADIVFGNLETVLTNNPSSAKDTGREQIFAFRSPPIYAQLFADVGFNVFNVGNNHAMDFGQVGFQDTKKNLGAVGIKTIGEKDKILYLQVKNISIAIIGFCPYEFCNDVNDLAATNALVKEAKTKAKIAIVSMHVGAEGTQALHVRNQTEIFLGENRGNAWKFARTAIDAGADLVLGHGPHVPRAMEVYKGKLIAYSLGNFLGYRTLSTEAETGYSMILEVKVNLQGDLISSKIIPMYLDRQGIPHVDDDFRTVRLMRNLINSDFAGSPISINQQGEVVFAQ